MNRSRRALFGATAALLLSATAVTVLAPAAQAAPITHPPLVAWANTDSARPDTPAPSPTGDAVVGTVAGRTARAYFTYDLSAYRTQVVHEAQLFTSERSVQDCQRVAPIEIWRTKPVADTTTWQQAPKELELVAQGNLGTAICPAPVVTFDVLPQIQAALGRHDKTITFEVRVAAAAESDPGLGRTVRQLSLDLTANHPPTVSGLKVLNPDRPCGTLAKHATAGGNSTRVTATATDADGTPPTPQIWFAVWPVDHPEQRTESTSVALHLSGYPDGTVVAWAAQARDLDDAGPWSRTCYLTVDNTAPATAPVVSSPKYNVATYPGTGGPGDAGDFVFDAAGDRDVVGFVYRTGNLGATTYVDAGHPGGRARVSLTPTSAGSAELQVSAVDLAQNRGPFQSYRYYVRATAPAVKVDVAGVGLTSHVTLKSPVAEVTSFGYALDAGTETVVPAVDATATGDVVFPDKGWHTIKANGYVHQKLVGTYTETILVSDAPVIASEQFGPSTGAVAGEPGSFTFTPRTTNVVSYQYDFGDGVQQSIDAAADGTAKLDWTPQAGDYTLTVSSVSADGTVSDPSTRSFWVIDTRPTVWFTGASASDNGGAGQPVTIWMSSELPGAEGFVYSFDGGPERTVDGSYISAEVVPDRVGPILLTVRARLADGTLTPETTVTVTVTDAPFVSVTGPDGGAPKVGQEATVTFRPAVPGVVAYRYPSKTEWADIEIPAGPDGSATFTYVPEYSGYDNFSVTSVTADGTLSENRWYEFNVE
ncbi:hypothetical protein HH310_26170 [Actinoplanes sp. TBRC 11911]|uniref:hypothetical protein n=1 Tax=Actinoplanes sp. TBRC 11911 TaxID=2729386 RepID=UPI00145E2828|nr:hypothetical protein [Actinoplanes sp. TBRC 11911]NMO54659.1 hypothetical protein [Actinoplanes sp. TBRC 11911]